MTRLLQVRLRNSSQQAISYELDNMPASDLSLLYNISAVVLCSVRCGAACVVCVVCAI